MAANRGSQRSGLLSSLLAVTMWLACGSGSPAASRPGTGGEADERPRSARHAPRAEPPARTHADEAPPEEIPEEEMAAELDVFYAEHDVLGGLGGSAVGGVPGGVVGGVISGPIEAEVGGLIGAPRAPDSRAQKMISSAALAARRTSGEAIIAPPERVRARIVRDRKQGVTAKLKLCLSEEGRITTVEVLESSGFRAYDHALMEGVWTWEHRPVMVDDQPVPVCALLTFTYAPRPGQPD